MNTKRKLSCCVPICKGERFDLAHKFPRDPERVELWLEALDCPKLNSIPVQKLGYVCSRHFRVKDYKHPLSRSINKTAIPSLNLKDLNQLHLSKDSALPSQGVNTVPEQNDEDSLFRKGNREQGWDIDNVPSEECCGDNLNSLDNFAETENEISNEQLTVRTYVDDEDDSQGQTRYSTFFQVNHPNYLNSISLNSFWLRCHCECHLCYDPIRRQRKVSPMDINEGVQPKSVKQVDGLDVLLIEWDDSHKSEYDVDFLFNLEAQKIRRTLPRKTWHSRSPAITDYIPIEFERLISFDKDCETIFHNLSELRVALISNIPAHGLAMAKLTLCRLFPHLEAEAISFREFNDIHADVSSNITYFSVDCGLRCYFAKEETELILVDGLHVANCLKTSNANAFKTLSEVLVPLDITDRHVKCEVVAPVIEIDASKQVISQLHLDVYKIGILNTLQQEKVESFYDSLRLMMRCVAEKRNQWLLKLQPGSMVILENSTIFHKCCGMSGVWEAHIQRKDYVSRMRHFGLV